jgi:hypothetical protein
MKKRNKRARRRPEYENYRLCSCACCRERDQLLECANTHPLLLPREQAVLFLEVCRDIAGGQYGGVSIENCFD